MHIYPWQIDPTPSQLSIDALNTATPNLVDLHPPSIEHRCLEYTTPNLAGLLADLPLSIEHRCLEYYNTKLGRSTGRSTPCN